MQVHNLHNMYEMVTLCLYGILGNYGGERSHLARASELYAWERASGCFRSSKNCTSSATSVCDSSFAIKLEEKFQASLKKRFYLLARLDPLCGLFFGVHWTFEAFLKVHRT